MAKTHRWLPFGWLPGHWGLSGETRERAKIEYEYDGFERDIKLIELADDSPERKKKLLKTKLEYQVIDDRDFQLGIIDIETEGDPVKNKLAKLTLDFDQDRISFDDYALTVAEVEFGKESVEFKLAEVEVMKNRNQLTDLEYEKKVATIKQEPWVRVASSSYDPQDGIDGFSFELDYNHFFLQFLKENGYTGLRDDEIVEEWFNDISKSELAAEIEADLSIPKTSIQQEPAKTESGKDVRKFS